MDLALIGNCAYQALIDSQGSVQWLCWPRFDSSFVFGKLLDDQHGGELSARPASAEFASEQEYLPNTNILRTQFRAADGCFELIDFAPRFRQFERYYKPTMLVRRLRRISGQPRVNVTCRPVYDYGKSQLDSYTASNHIQWSAPGGPLRLTTNVPLTYVKEGRPFLLEKDAYVVVTWGAPLEAALEETAESFLARTRKYWERWVKHNSLPGIFQKEVIRSSLALKLHQYEDTGAITAATTTSLPEHDGSGRNWDYRFCWLRDSYFTLKAMRRLNLFEEMEAFVAFLGNVAAGAGGKLQPVFGISGESELTETTLDHLAGYRNNRPVRIGNAAYKQIQNDVYGEMVAAVAPLFLDLRFADQRSDNSIELVRGLLTRIGDTLEVPDAGLWEIRDEPQVHTFSLLMHWVGATLAERIGHAVSDLELESRARGLASRARNVIEQRCYRPDLGYYADAVQKNNADASLMMLVNLGYLSPEDPRAERHVRNLAERLAATDDLLHRYVHHDGIGETLNTFTVCAFWYAEALARLGKQDEARALCDSLVGRANHVGLFSEDIDPKTGEQWGNFPQTYSHVGLINTAFAISPLPGD